MQLSRYVDGRLYRCEPARSGIFYILWCEGKRSKRHSTGARSVPEAQAYLDEWCRLTAAEKQTSELTCTDLFEARYSHAADRVRFAWANLRPHFGHLRPIDVTDEVERAYIAARGVAGSTIRFELSCLRTSWNHAVKRRVLRSDQLPVLGALPPASPPRDRWLSDDETARLFAAAEGHRRLWLFLWLALETAARRTAIQELRWSQVDWEVGVIHYLPPGARQSRKRRASVPISSALLPVLEAAFAEKVDDFVIGAGGKVNEAVNAAARRARVSGVTPHVLRHTAATRMARAGVSLWIIAQVLGNTVEQVEKTYAKYQPDMARKGVEAISGRRAA